MVLCRDCIESLCDSWSLGIIAVQSRREQDTTIWAEGRRTSSMQRAKQSSDSVEVAVFLALSGGLMDAYSYLARGEVFANAQTGNILLMGISIADGNFSRALAYLFPITCFALGIAIAHRIRLLSKERHAHWRQIALALEMCLLLVVAFLPASINLVANSLTSLACGIQVQAFRKLHGHPIATTMCIGNLRSGTQDLVSYTREHDRRLLENALFYYGTIVCFVVGAIIGSRLIPMFGLTSIVASPVLLLGPLLLMCWDREASAER